MGKLQVCVEGPPSSWQSPQLPCWGFYPLVSDADPDLSDVWQNSPRCPASRLSNLGKDGRQGRDGGTGGMGVRDSGEEVRGQHKGFHAGQRLWRVVGTGEQDRVHAAKQSAGEGAVPLQAESCNSDSEVTSGPLVARSEGLNRPGFLHRQVATTSPATAALPVCEQGLGRSAGGGEGRTVRAGTREAQCRLRVARGVAGVPRDQARLRATLRREIPELTCPARLAGVPGLHPPPPQPPPPPPPPPLPLPSFKL